VPTLQFKGKPLVQNHHLVVPFSELDAVKSRGLSKSPSLHDNLIIEGDNLKALKALLPTYHGKVKCIYIDPPYNTGNEAWIYNDKVNSPMIRDWLGKTVDRDDLTRHDKWCCMMLPRLKLLRELLTDDGAIFISIDDNEVHHLRALMDEVFGAENFVATVIWQMSDGPKNTKTQFSEDHEYLVVYARYGPKWIPNRLARTEAMIARYKNPDNDPRGDWLLSDLAARNVYSQGRYSITTPTGRVIDGPPAGSYWRVNKAKFEELNKDGRIWWGESGDNRPGMKRFLSEVQEGVVPRTIWLWKDAGSTRHSKQEFSQIMAAESGSDLFITPKPVSLLSKVVRMSTEGSDICARLICRHRHDSPSGARVEQGRRRQSALHPMPDALRDERTGAKERKHLREHHGGARAARDKGRAEGEGRESAQRLGWNILLLQTWEGTEEAGDPRRQGFAELRGARGICVLHGHG
jgi:DNA modification methylase